MTAADAMVTLAVSNSPAHARRLCVVDAARLVPTARQVADHVTAWCDDVRESVTLPDDVRHDGVDGLRDALAGADLVWLGVPTALAALDELACLTAAFAAPDARLVAMGRHADLNRTMNEVLARHFAGVHASRGVGKLRALVADDPMPSDPSVWPKTRHVSDLGLDVVAHGATFAFNRLDPGTAALVPYLDDVPLGDVLDFGSGSGVLAALLARREGQPPGRISAIDVRMTSVDATGRTAAANGVDVRTAWADGTSGVADACFDAIVTNPPFHDGPAKDSSATLAMFADAARVLRPGGEIWVVFNSHLPWKARLSHAVGPTRLVAQNPRYTVVRTTRPS